VTGAAARALAVGVALIAALAPGGCGSGRAEKRQTWIERSSESRSAGLLEELDDRARFLHLAHALVRFAEVPHGRGPAHEDPAGEAIVFVHGFGGTMGDFAPVILSMRGGERLVAFDLPGFGGSLRDDERYTIDGYVECLEELLGRLGVRRANLVCHSLGGQICIAAALSRVPSISTLTLIDTAGVYDPARFVQGISKRMGRVNVGEVSTARGRTLFDVATSDGEIAKRILSRKPATLAALASFAARYRDRVGQISVPVLVIWGSEDPVFSLEDAFLLKENIPGARLHVAEGAGHAPQLTHPELVVGWLEGHLADVRRKAGGKI
jgi:pyruvate dehydrogenase E2 component (dihydrolipoamide acetyltransferase)